MLVIFHKHRPLHPVSLSQCQDEWQVSSPLHLFSSCPPPFRTTAGGRLQLYGAPPVAVQMPLINFTGRRQFWRNAYVLITTLALSRRLARQGNIRSKMFTLHFFLLYFHFFLEFCLSQESFNINILSLWICLWGAWNEQDGQYGLSWHQFDIASAPFCLAMNRLALARTCQLKSSVTCWVLTCHFASPSQAPAAQKCPQPCIYPKARLPLPSSPRRSRASTEAGGEFTAGRIVPNRSADRDDRSFWTVCAVLLLFSRVRRGHPPRPTPQIHRVLV